MLKRRVVGVLIVRENIVVQSIGFKKYLPIGKPNVSIEFLNQWGIDEIILLDISASKNGKQTNFDFLKKMTSKCFVPLTIGGGITDIVTIKELMHCGADKISLNRAIHTHPKLISEAALLFGNQCIVASIDAVKTTDGYKVFDYYHKKITDICPFNLAADVEKKGAGEILINSVDRDGSYLGYDINLINQICDKVSIPVICCGGAGKPHDMIQVLIQTNVSGAAAANFFHFYEHSVICSKALISKQINVRIETFADYNDHSFDEEGRPLKRDEKTLEEMLYIKIDKEII
jgi:cyclase